MAALLTLHCHMFMGISEPVRGQWMAVLCVLSLTIQHHTVCVLLVLGGKPLISYAVYMGTFQELYFLSLYH